MVTDRRFDALGEHAKHTVTCSQGHTTTYGDTRARLTPLAAGHGPRRTHEVIRQGGRRHAGTFSTLPAAGAAPSMFAL